MSTFVQGQLAFFYPNATKFEKRALCNKKMYRENHLADFLDTLWLIVFG
jgi:hypothetical protein